MMTPEERADQIHLFGGKADNTDVRAAIAAAIREAEAEAMARSSILIATERFIAAERFCALFDGLAWRFDPDSLSAADAKALDAALAAWKQGDGTMAKCYRLTDAGWRAALEADDRRKRKE